MAENHWGYHLLVNAQQGDRELISSFENVRAFVEQLVLDIDMVKYGSLWIDRFATHDPEKAGISFCQMIETSNITGHFAEETGNFYIDIFSCKPYDAKVVQELVEEYFAPMSVTALMVYRDSNKFSFEVL
jgi:S-adenosylmethionine/arginine decarboxylase-like enzyme